MEKTDYGETLYIKVDPCTYVYILTVGYKIIKSSNKMWSTEVYCIQHRYIHEKQIFTS